MPSFQAKPTLSSDMDALSMADVFDDGNAEQALRETLQLARKRAREILQDKLPGHIRKLDQLLAAADNESSCLWIEHLERGMFQVENVVLTEVRDSPIIVLNGKSTSTENGNQASAGQHGNGAASRHDDDDLTGCWLGGLASNEVCLDIMRIVERETQTSMVLYLDLKRWVALEVPKVEDGNNFGVEVQQHVLDKITASNRACQRIHGIPRSHFNDRMELGRTWNRFPNLKDHAPAIAASDRYDFFLALQGIKDLRDGAAELLHTIRENWAKIYDPKNATAGGGASMGGMY